MKSFLLFLVIGFVLGSPVVYSQSMSGKLSVSGFSKDAVIKEKSPVELFKSFKESKYKIDFSFKGQYPPQQPVLFDMLTTVKKNGKVIGSSRRPGWPWLPGDMFVPAEAFDFIPILQKGEGRQVKGTKANTLTDSYDIILEMKVSSGQDVTGSIAPVTVSFKF